MIPLKKTVRRVICAVLTAAMLCSDAGLTVYAVEAAEQGALAETAEETLTEDVQLGEDAVEGDKTEAPSQEGGQTQEQQTEEAEAEDPQEKSPSMEEEQPGENPAGDGNTETPSGEEPDIEEEDSTAAAAEEEEELFESEIGKEAAFKPEMKTVERKLTGVYQFGGAPSREDIAAVRGTSAYSADNDDTAELEEFIYQQMLERKTEIDLGDYSVALNADEADSIVEAVLNEHPDLYFVGSELGYSGIDSGEGFVVTTISPNYYTDMEDAAFAAAVAEALKAVKSDMSDLEKAIVLHDYLAVNCEYDKINFDMGYVPPDSHSAYGALVNRTAVCDGYALAYKHLLNQVHIQCYMVESDAMNHAWNLIELGGSYYQVDVTWDDPIWDLIGRARHEYMFRSDDAFQNQCGERHYDWYVTEGSEVVDYSATDTRYDNAFWVNCDSPLIFEGGDCYYTAYDTQSKKCAIQKTALSDLTGSGEAVCSFDRWTVWGGGGGWPGVFSGLFQINDRLYYNDKTSIYSISLDNTENGLDKRTVFTADTTNGYIYGSAFCQGKVLYSLHQTPNLTEKETVLTADLTVEPEEKITLDKSAVTLKIGETVQLTVTAAPDNVTDEEVTWESSQNSVATVENGIVTAIVAGKCTITASAGGKTAVCAVTVTDGTQADIIASGENKKNGSDTRWTIDADWKLTLEGRGEFERKYVTGANQQGWCLPWSDYEHEIKTAEVNVSGMTDASYLFYECDNLVSVDLSGFDTSQVTNMKAMFCNCKSLITLDLSNFDTGKVTDMSDMFSRCSALTTLCLENFDTAQVTSMQCMFWSCKSLTDLDLSSFDASQVAAAGSGMSIGASGEEYIGGMCLGCDKLETIHTPYNLKVSSELPEGVWYQPDGTELTELPQNLDHSILIKKGEVPAVSFIVAEKTKTDYVCGDILNLDDIMVTYCDVDGTVHKLGNGDYTTNADEVDMSTAGKKNLMITYRDGESVFTYEIELTVTAKEIENPSDTITLNVENTAVTFRDTSDCVYDGTPKTPEVTVVYTAADGQSVTLEKEKDYTAAYENNVNVFEDTAALETAQDAPRVVITGCGRCSGTVSKAFLIRKALPQEVAAPTANPESESQLSAGSKVTLACGTAGAEIYYTTGASVKELADPTEKGTRYTEPLTINNDMYIRAVAMKGDNRSKTVTFHYTVLIVADQVMKPYAVPGQGVVGKGTKIELKSDMPDAVIYYVTGKNADVLGAVPADDSCKYTAPIEITEDMVIKAVARKEGMKDSDAAVFAYRVNVAINAPAADPATGTEVEQGSYISLTADSDADIYYTTDQSDPAVSGTAKLYERKIRVDGDAGSVIAIRAAAVKKGIYSETVTFTYTVSGNKAKGLHVMLAGSDEFIYTGSAITPAVIVTNNGEELTEGEDYTIRYSNNVKAADKDAARAPRITVTGKGNLTKSRSITFSIMPMYIGDEEEVVGGSIVAVRGKTAAPVLFYGGVKLTAKDFVNPSARKKYNADETITITGKGNFEGTRDIDVRVVNKEDMKKFTVVIDNTALKKEPLVYDGEEKTMDGYFEVFDTQDKSSPLEEYSDYAVIYPKNNINAGKVKFTVVGLGEYFGTVTKTYTIKPRVVKTAEDGDMQVNVEDGDGYAFKNGGVTISDLLVTCDGDTLIPGKDYKVTYSGNKKICTDNKAKCTISFKGNYKGSKSLVRKFHITPAVLDDVDQITGSVSVAAGDMVYTGKRGAYKSVPYVTVNGALLKSSDYKVSYYKDPDRKQVIDGKTAESSVELVGQDSQTVYVKIEGKGNYEGVLTAEYNVYKLAEGDIDLARAKITIVGGNKQVYTGEGVMPDIEILYKSGTEWKKVDPNDIGTYVKVTYINHVNKGKATVMVNGTGGKYAGSKTAIFTIVAKSMN